MPENHTLIRYLQLLSQNKKKLCDEYGVKSIALFGSYVRNEQHKRSDLDILVDLEEKYETFDNYFNLKAHLSKILRKRKIDLVIKSSLEPRRGKYILEEAVYA